MSVVEHYLSFACGSNFGHISSSFFGQKEGAELNVVPLV